MRIEETIRHQEALPAENLQAGHIILHDKHHHGERGPFLSVVLQAVTYRQNPEEEGGYCIGAIALPVEPGSDGGSMQQDRIIIDEDEAVIANPATIAEMGLADGDLSYRTDLTKLRRIQIVPSADPEQPSDMVTITGTMPPGILGNIEAYIEQQGRENLGLSTDFARACLALVHQDYLDDLAPITAVAEERRSLITNMEELSGIPGDYVVRSPHTEDPELDSYSRPDISLVNAKRAGLITDEQYRALEWIAYDDHPMRGYITIEQTANSKTLRELHSALTKNIIRPAKFSPLNPEMTLLEARRANLVSSALELALYTAPSQGPRHGAARSSQPVPIRKLRDAFDLVVNRPGDLEQYGRVRIQGPREKAGMIEDVKRAWMAVIVDQATFKAVTGFSRKHDTIEDIENRVLLRPFAGLARAPRPKF